MHSMAGTTVRTSQDAFVMAAFRCFEEQVAK
jgi:hypothetical protein